MNHELKIILINFFVQESFLPLLLWLSRDVYAVALAPEGTDFSISLILLYRTLPHNADLEQFRSHLEAETARKLCSSMGSVLKKSSRENRPQLWESGQHFPIYKNKKKKKQGSWTHNRAAEESSACVATHLTGKSFWWGREGERQGKTERGGSLPFSQGKGRKWVNWKKLSGLGFISKQWLPQRWHEDMCPDYRGSQTVQAILSGPRLQASNKSGC